jgi:hypothetical protein
MKSNTYRAAPVALTLLLLAVPSWALAQPGITGPYGLPTVRPPISPYLNLVRQGAPAGVNYYGIVRPQIATANAIQGLQQQVSGLETAEATGRVVGEPTTGHPVMFLNTGTYFNRNLSQRTTGGTGTGYGGRTGTGTGFGGQQPYSTTGGLPTQGRAGQIRPLR